MTDSNEMLDKYIKKIEESITDYYLINTFEDDAEYLSQKINVINNLEELRKRLINIDVELFKKYVDFDFKILKDLEMVGILEKIPPHKSKHFSNNGTSILLYCVNMKDFSTTHTLMIDDCDGYERYKKALIRKQRKQKIDRVNDK